MNKLKDKYIVPLVSIGLFLISIFKIDFTFVETSDLAVFISIIIGYQITSVSVLYNSRMLNKLHKDIDNEYTNKLNRIANYYRNSILWGILFVLVIIFIKNDYVKNIDFKIVNISISKYSFFASLTFIILYNFVRGNFIFFKIFVLPRNEK